MEFSVVNYTPFQFREDKPGLIPGQFMIPPARDNEKIPGVIHIVNAKSRLHIPLQERPFYLTEDAETLAKALVGDLLDGMIEREQNIAEPAIFYVSGHHAPMEIKTKFPEEVNNALSKQNLWLIKLVKKGDDEWQKTRQHKFITDMQRWACKKLNFKREWMEISAATPLELTDCKFFGTKILMNIALCPNCKQVVNQTLFNSLTGAASPLAKGA